MQPTQEQTSSHGFLDAFQLKVVLAALMVLDHLYYNLFPDKLLWAHIAARVVAPAFCYLVTEGMIHTRDRGRYIRRMFAFGAGMWAGNLCLYFVYGEWINNSILLSLAVGASLIHCTERRREAVGREKAQWTLAALGLYAWAILPDFLNIPLLRFFRMEGGLMIPLMAIIFYFLRARPAVLWAVYFAVYGLPYLIGWAVAGRLETQFWAVLVFLPILCYNGRRGRGGAFAKYFFYLFYPLHIWIIFLIEQAVLR